MKQINKYVLRKSAMELDPPTTFKDFPEIVKLTDVEGEAQELYYVDAFGAEYHTCHAGQSGEVSLFPVFRNGSTGELMALLPFCFTEEEFLFWCRIKQKNPSDLVESWEMYLRAKRAEIEYAEKLQKGSTHE